MVGIIEQQAAAGYLPNRMNRRQFQHALTCENSELGTHVAPYMQHSYYLASTASIN
jgi:hypothetical protein